MKQATGGALRPWTGLLGGAAAWYAAHDASFYLSAADCHERWIVPTIHVAAVVACGICGWRSYRSLPRVGGAIAWDEARGLEAGIGAAAAALFAVVVVWQGAAAVALSGCAR
jgi:hypothetical protein